MSKHRELASILLVIAVVVGIGSTFFLKKDDNIIEETSEELIEGMTGAEIDLTPSSPEEPVCKKDAELNQDD